MARDPLNPTGVLPPMLQFIQYYGKYQSLRGNLGTMPAWGRFVVAIFALPGLVILLAAMLAFVIGLGVLMLLTIPVYRAVRAVASIGQRPAAGRDDGFVVTEAADVVINPAPRRQIDVKIVE